MPAGIRYYVALTKDAGRRAEEITGHDEWIVTEALATALVALEQLEPTQQSRQQMDDIRKLLAARNYQPGTLNLPRPSQVPAESHRRSGRHLSRSMDLRTGKSEMRDSW